MANVQPPRISQIWNITTDNTARPYDLNLIDFSGETSDGSNSLVVDVFLTLQALGDDIYFQFSPTTSAALDPAATIAAAGALTSTTAMGWRLPEDGEISVRINRAKDRWLILRSATAGALLLRASSHSV